MVSNPQEADADCKPAACVHSCTAAVALAGARTLHDRRYSMQYCKHPPPLHPPCGAAPLPALPQHSCATQPACRGNAYMGQAPA
jgi:hypothetical protein